MAQSCTYWCNFNTKKRESIYLDGLPKSFRELEDRISKFIEIYIMVRPHEHLDYCSPEEFEKSFAEKPIKSCEQLNNCKLAKKVVLGVIGVKNRSKLGTCLGFSSRLSLFHSHFSLF